MLSMPFWSIAPWPPDVIPGTKSDWSVAAADDDLDFKMLLDLFNRANCSRSLKVSSSPYRVIQIATFGYTNGEDVLSE